MPAYAGPPICAECGRRHAPGLLHAAGCMACTREKAKGRKQRDSMTCSHRCSCGQRLKMNKRGYVLSIMCDGCDQRFHDRLAEIAASPDPSSPGSVFGRTPRDRRYVQ